MHDQNDPIELDEQPLRAWDEFAPDADEMPELADGLTRRSFMQRMAASMALAGLAGAGCNDRPTDEKIVPYVQAPEGVQPGKPVIFASAMPLNGYGKGVLVTSREGRPIKIEGNPQHPSTLGGTDVFLQASILDIYDPARSQTPTRAGTGVDASTFWAALGARLETLSKVDGEGLRFLSGTITSPSLIDLIQSVQRKYPKARWHTYDPMDRANRRAGNVLAFGKPLSVHFDLKPARVILSLDSDFLFDDLASLRYAREFMNARRVRVSQLEMNRLYVAESTFSITGSMADHRLPIRPANVAMLAQAIAAEIGVAGVSAVGLDAASARWVKAVAEDLKSQKGTSLIVVGESQPPVVHALAMAINEALGNLGKTVLLSESTEFGVGDASRSLKSLADDMTGGKVDTLLILGGNPAMNAPAEVDFAGALRAMSTDRQTDDSSSHFTAHLGVYSNETAFLCQWHLPEAHYLEAWGDVRAHDGTATIIQPLISPLYGGQSIAEFLGRLIGQVQANGYEIVRSYWQKAAGTKDFEGWWQATLNTGVVAGSASSLISASCGKPDLSNLQGSANPAAIDIVFRPDYSVWDGTFAGNTWLMECPRPFSKLVWDNAALLDPATATRLGLAGDDVVKVTVRNQSAELPVALLPGLPDGVITLHLGYGRGPRRSNTTDTGLGDTHGVNVYPIRFSDASGFSANVDVARTGKAYKLVRTHNHHAMGGPTTPTTSSGKALKPHAIVTPQTSEAEKEVGNRRLVRVVSLGEFKAQPKIVEELGGEREKRPLLSLYPEWDYSKGYQWGMSIDQTACMGCNACLVACQAENNIPVVGKDQVEKQREMHWIRIDDYFDSASESPLVVHQPVPCQHCENASCEYVCPVGATSHSAEGLNQMTYNRCVGTRYCSNNCAYKVRRFNFFDFNIHRETPQQKMLANPEVTVRTRGVMEKCTYCVQRIQNTRIEAEVALVNIEERIRALSDENQKTAMREEGRKREHEIVEGMQTACQQACPTQAIVFGSILNVGGQPTKVKTLKDEPLDYTLLRELTTKPRTSYMARVRNPNPALEGAHSRGEA